MNLLTIESILNVLKHNFLNDIRFANINEDNPADSWAYRPLMDKLRRVGFKKLGNGHFSVAYTHKQLPNKVIKISLKRDDAYEMWLDFCQANKADGLPVIHYRTKWDRHSVVILDRMESLLQSEISYWDSYRLRDGIENVLRYRLVFLTEDVLRLEEKLILKMLKDNAPELLEVAKLYKVTPEEVRLDLNMGNIMLFNGKLVVTDPWCGH